MKLLKNCKGVSQIDVISSIVLMSVMGSMATAKFQDFNDNAMIVIQRTVAAEAHTGSVLNYTEGTLDGSFTQHIDNTRSDCAVIVDELLVLPVDTSHWAIHGSVSSCTGAGMTVRDCYIVDNSQTLSPMAIPLMCTG